MINLDLTILDYIYIAVVLASTVWATIRGGVYETVATFSWIIAAVAARFVSPMIGEIFQEWFKLSEPTVGTLISSYFVVFFVILVLFGLFNQRLRDRIQESMMKVTDHTLGVIFGIIRGIIMMGIIYWGMLWYYSDAPMLPEYITTSHTRPIMQLTAVKIQEWFIPGTNKLLERDMTGTKESIEVYNNLINPAVKSEKEEINLDDPDNENADIPKPETGYKNSERTALENQLLQIENAAKAEEKITDTIKNTDI